MRECASPSPRPSQGHPLGYPQLITECSDRRSSVQGIDYPTVVADAALQLHQCCALSRPVVYLSAGPVY